MSKKQFIHVFPKHRHIEWDLRQYTVEISGRKPNLWKLSFLWYRISKFTKVDEDTASPTLTNTSKNHRNQLLIASVAIEFIGWRHRLKDMSEIYPPQKQIWPVKAFLLPIPNEREELGEHFSLDLLLAQEVLRFHVHRKLYFFIVQAPKKIFYFQIEGAIQFFKLISRMISLKVTHKLKSSIQEDEKLLKLCSFFIRYSSNELINFDCVVLNFFFWDFINSLSSVLDYTGWGLWLLHIIQP